MTGRSSDVIVAVDLLVLLATVAPKRTLVGTWLVICVTAPASEL